MTELFLLGFIFFLLLFRLITVLVAWVNNSGSTRLQLVSASTSRKISILIPARNEEKSLPKTLEALLQLPDPIHEILILDDFSTDATAAIVSVVSRHEPKVKLITGNPLPAGWLGKNWACHQLGQQATGDFFLFIDADVILKPHSIDSAAEHFSKYRLALLSIFPDQIMITAGEKAVVPVMHHILLSLLPLPLVRKSEFPSLSAANGQFMLFDRETYQNHRFHELEKGSVAEDIRIVRRMKTLKLKVDCLLGNDLVLCRMYSNFSESLKGFSKNILQMLGASQIGSLILLFLLHWGWIVFLLSPWWWLILIDISLVALNRYLVSNASNQNPFLNILLWPAQSLVMTYLVFKGIYNRWTKQLEWKGRTVSS
ncbi:MAG: glycosyltransferase family 2 protein [Bacteroidetes bacterium]|nr:glycosyltransferase family 2 protein [Bacteroidota bacterium]